MFAVRTLIMVCCLAALAFAQSQTKDNNYSPIDLKEISKHEGHRVVITADIVSVNADQQKVVVFDNDSKTLANVSLTQLAKSQRQTLVATEVHRVSVFGRVEVKNGRATIKADQVMPLAVNLVASK